jgi:hypothetical protein
LKKKKRWLIAGLGVVILAVSAGFGFQVYHEQPSFCSLCHIMEPYVDSLTGGEATAMGSGHYKDDVVCIDCHEPTLEQQMEELEIYISGDYETPLKQRRFDQEWCLRCHGSYEEIAEQPAVLEMERNPHGSHYGELDCRICHKMHQTSELYCASCHDDVTIPDGWVAYSID